MAKNNEITTMRLSYVGEPVTAAGFALIGASTHTPPLEAGVIWPLLLKLRPHTDLLLLNHAHAESVATQLAQLLQEEPLPPVLVLPGMEQDTQPEFKSLDVARRVLGLSHVNSRRDTED